MKLMKRKRNKSPFNYLWDGENPPYHGTSTVIINNPDNHLGPFIPTDFKRLRWEEDHKIGFNIKRN